MKLPLQTPTDRKPSLSKHLQVEILKKHLLSYDDVVLITVQWYSEQFVIVHCYVAIFLTYS